MVQVPEVSVVAVLENEAGCLLIVGFHNVLDFANVGVIEGFHNLVLSSDLLGIDGNENFDGYFLVVSFIGALKNMGVSATTKLPVDHIIIHISLYKHWHTPI